MTPPPHRVYPSAVYGLGLFGVYLGERIIDAGKATTIATVAGLALVVIGLVARGLELGRQPAARRPSERLLMGLAAAGAVALGLYFLNSNLFFKLTGRTFEQDFPRGSGVVGTLWPALLLCGTLPVILVEMSLATMKRAPVLDQRRVRAAMMSGLGLAFALVFSFAVAYVAVERDVKFDLSYFRTARAGDASKNLVRALDKPVRVYLFFPPANEVCEEVESYFADLTRESKQLVVEHYDHALHPAKARELNVTGNGIIVIGREAVREQIALPLQLERARTPLRVLDQDMHKKIIAVSRPDRNAYFVQGHEERTFEPLGDTDKRATVRSLKELLAEQSFEPKELGMAQGLATEVPADAAMVLIVGPRRPFMKEETGALQRYLDRKGRLLIALDPDAGQTMADVLAPLALKYRLETLANDEFYIRRNHQDSDRTIIATGSYSSHASVSTIGRFGLRAPVVMLGAGYLEKDEKAAIGIVNVDFTVHAAASTWNDKNGNFQHDSDSEVRTAYELAAAVSKRNASAIAVDDEARVVVLADSDLVGDEAFRHPPNTYLIRDAIRWLSGDEAVSGVINTEEDVPVTHTRKQDTILFYGSVFAVPLLLLALGFLMTRRRRPRKMKPQPVVPSAATPSPSEPVWQAQVEAPPSDPSGSPPSPPPAAPGAAS